MYIKSVKYGEYLLAGSDKTSYDGSRRRVFAWRRKPSEPGDWNGQGDWLLERLHDGGYTMKSTFFNEFLYAAASSYAIDGQRRSVFTWKTVGPVDQWLDGRDKGVWLLEPIGDNTFRIRNKSYGEYLYAAANDLAYSDQLGSVFTWNDATCPVDQWSGDDAYKADWMFQDIHCKCKCGGFYDESATYWAPNELQLV